MNTRRSRQLLCVAAAIAVTLATTQSASAARGPKRNGKSSGPSTVWSGNGARFDGYGYTIPAGDCATASPYIDFVLASVKGVSNATIQFSDGPELSMTKSNGGKRGVSSFKYRYTSEDLIDVGALMSAGVTARWSGGEGAVFTADRACGVFSDMDGTELRDAGHQQMDSPFAEIDCTGFAGWEAGPVLRAATDGMFICGSSTWSDKADLSWATTLTASFSYTVSSAFTAADGLAFVVQDTSTTALGLDGYTLGYLQGGMTNSLAVAFRTWDFQNIVVSQDMTDWLDAGLAKVADSGALVGHDVVIEIERSAGAATGTLSIYLDGSGTAALTTTVDWPTATSYMGFTAGNGGAAQASKVSDLLVTWHN